MVRNRKAVANRFFLGGKKAKNRFFPRGKKAAIGATMTWVVATIIIFVVIIIFVYAAKGFAGSKWVRDIVGRDSVNVIKDSSNADSEQMLLALLQTNIDGKSVKDYVENTNNFEKEFPKLKQELNPILEKIPAGKGYKWTLLINIPPSPEFQLGNKIIWDPTLMQDIVLGCDYVYLKDSKVKLCKIGEV